MITGDSGPLTSPVFGDEAGILAAVNTQTLTLSLTGSQSSGAALPITSGSAGNNPAAQLYLDALGYGSIGAVLTSLGTGPGSVAVKVSNDGSTWDSVLVADQTSQASTPTTTISSVTHGVQIPGGFRYYQFTLSAAQTAGTTNLEICLKASSGWSPSVSLGSSTQAIGGLAAATTGGATTYSPVAGLVGGTLTSIKGAAGNLYAGDFYNPNASVVYLNFYNATSITYGTTVPIYSLPIAATATGKIGPFTVPIAFSADLYYTVSTSTSSLTAPGSNLVGTVVYQ